MQPPMRLALASLAAVLGLFALHVELNHGGWARTLRRLQSDVEIRGELVVGFLPVT